MEGARTTPTVLISALELARRHGGAAEALRATGLDLDGAERFVGFSEDLEALLSAADGSPVEEALALGFLAGRIAHRPRPRRSFDPTSFVLDRDLSVIAAAGESILRLPWFDEGLFVGRQLPDIAEIPFHVRKLATTHYRMGLAGERSRFVFTSYGHRYTVETVPMRGELGTIESVLGIATPAYPTAHRLRSALACDRGRRRPRGRRPQRRPARRALPRGGRRRERGARARGRRRGTQGGGAGPGQGRAAAVGPPLTVAQLSLSSSSSDSGGSATACACTACGARTVATAA
jgi:hypothetical protein